MTEADLQRLEREIEPIVLSEGAPLAVREQALRFNDEVAEVREALLAPMLGLLTKGGVRPELASCLTRTIAELAFWRRVLVKVHGSAVPSAPGSPEFLVGYLRS